MIGREDRTDMNKEGSGMWRPMKGKADEWGQTDEQPNPIENLLRTPHLSVMTPRSQLQTNRPGTYQKEGREGFPAMAQASRDAHVGKQRQKQRKTEQKKRSGVPSYVTTACRDTPIKVGCLDTSSGSAQKTGERKERTRSGAPSMATANPGLA